ncbi:sensor histidine kinase [Litorimonas sp. WD9-15]|uniref:sensor histidine kinase n=1 Tax=Litorimonas sp. WD9-15 TaxID=3418716 RepID=UPI003D008EAD
MRIDQSLGAADLLRARAVYMLGWVFLFSQVINLTFMSYAYGTWTFDHWIAASVMVIIFTATHLLRYTKAFTGYAIAYSALMLIGILATSIPDQTGINTAMLPLLVAGAVINGFISGWRMVFVYANFSLALVWFLYSASITWPVPIGVSPVDYQARAFMRAVQTTIAFSIVSTGLAVFSISMHRLFDLLEKNIKLAREADYAKSNFLANMSHELRTPLNGVIGMAGLMMKTDMTPTQRQYVEIIDGCSTGLVTIINDVLDLSKLDSGKAQFTYASFDLQKMLGSLVALNRPAALEKNLALELHWMGDTPTHIISDESRLRQVANNLIGNAVKFTESGRIDVIVQSRQIREDLTELCLFVRDTGVGIDEADLGRVFTRFEQVDNRLSSGTTGTGLGLSITRGLVEGMGGKVHVQSVVGEGTVFTIQLPVRIERRGTQVVQVPADKMRRSA